MKSAITVGGGPHYSSGVCYLQNDKGEKSHNEMYPHLSLNLDIVCHKLLVLSHRFSFGHYGCCYFCSEINKYVLEFTGKECNQTRILKNV